MEKDNECTLYHNELVDLILLLLCDTISNPDDVSDFLFLQSEVAVECTKLELALETDFVHLHFMFDEFIFKSALRIILEI